MSKFNFLVIFFISIVLTLFNVHALESKSFSTVIGNDDGRSNLNLPTSKLPGPVKPYCGKIDVTSHLSSKIQVNSNQRIIGVKRLEDNNYRYFAITVIDFSSATTNIWLFDIGRDGFFSNDDSVRKIINFPGTHHNAIDIVKMTRDTSNGGEELFWIERNSSSSASVIINRCDLPSCSQKINVANLPSGATHLLSTYNTFNLLPTDYGVYLVLHNNLNQMKEISYCSLISNDLNWCGNPAIVYSTIYSTPLINKIYGVNGEGIAFLDNSGKKFFNVNTWRIVPMPSGAIIESLVKGTIVFQNNSYNLTLFAEEKTSQTDLSALDINSGTSLYLDKIDDGINLKSILLEPRIRGFPLVLFNKLNNGNYNTLKKNSFGSEPLVIFEEINNWEPGDSFFTSDGNAYSYSRSDQKLYTYECNN